MDLQEFEKIKDLMKKAEIESAKNQGQIESIEKKWSEQGIKNLEQAKNKLSELEKQQEELTQKRDGLFEKLQNSYDWDKLENDL